MSLDGKSALWSIAHFRFIFLLISIALGIMIERTGKASLGAVVLFLTNRKYLGKNRCHTCTFRVLCLDRLRVLCLDRLVDY